MPSEDSQYWHYSRLNTSPSSHNPVPHEALIPSSHVISRTSNQYNDYAEGFDIRVKVKCAFTFEELQSGAYFNSLDESDLQFLEMYGQPVLFPWPEDSSQGGWSLQDQTHIHVGGDSSWCITAAQYAPHGNPSSFQISKSSTLVDALEQSPTPTFAQVQAQKREWPTRHVENVAGWSDVEARRPDQMLQVENICMEDVVGCMKEETRLEVEEVCTREEEIQRKEEECKRWEELHSLEDLTHEVQGRLSYPSASGGFGDIWKCVLVKPSWATQVAVAVKTIRAFEADDKNEVRNKAKRVRRELIVWGRLKHDSILPLWGVANDFGPYPAMICPWADNGALTIFLERQQDKLSSQDKFSLLNDIALGLQYLHGESVIHGDLTGSNVLINGRGRACLADFGLSTIMVEFIGTSYFTNSVWGNVRWAAAELYEAPENASLTTECDVYSFGSIILQILTCKVPYYYVKNDIAVLGQVIKGKKPEPPKELRIAPGHWRFIRRCWLPRASRPTVGEIVEFVGCEQRALSY